MERTKTGVGGLDELLNGGIPKNSVVLVSGAAGSGKTIFGLQFLINGALQYWERGITSRSSRRAMSSSRRHCSSAGTWIRWSGRGS